MRCALILVLLLSFVVYAGSGVWAYADAVKRGKPGFLVAALILLVSWPLSILIWIALRPNAEEFHHSQRHGNRGA